MLTNQEIFDIVINHARTQKCKAHDKDGSCRYRLPDGKMCFLGSLIPDALYNPDFEGESISKMGGRLNSLMKSAGYDIEFLADLQSIHDGIRVGKWESTFESLACLYGLNYNKTNQLVV